VVAVSSAAAFALDAAINTALGAAAAAASLTSPALGWKSWLKLAAAVAGPLLARAAGAYANIFFVDYDHWPINEKFRGILRVTEEGKWVNRCTRVMFKGLQMSQGARPQRAPTGAAGIAGSAGVASFRTGASGVVPV